MQTAQKIEGILLPSIKNLLYLYKLMRNFNHFLDTESYQDLVSQLVLL